MRLRLRHPSLLFLLPVLVRSHLLTPTSPHPQPPPPPTPTPTLPPPQTGPPLPTVWIATTAFLSATPPFLSPQHDALTRHPLPQPDGVGAAAGPANSLLESQLPAVTSWAEWTSYSDSGTWTQLHFVYTQLFSKVPAQGPSALSGEVGMGTLTGVVGAVRTVGAESKGNTVGVGVGEWGRWGVG